MGDFILTLDGAPQALSNLKLRLLLEKTVPKGLISALERKDDGSVILKFIKEKDLRQFWNENITTIEFGNEKHQITIREPVQERPVEERRQVFSHNWDDDPWRRKLFVTNIPRHLDSRQDLMFHFGRFGRVEYCYIKRNRFAYVLFADHLDALAALRGGRAAGPNFFLNIFWDRKEVVGPPAGQPRPLLGPVPRPQDSRGGPRRWSSTMDLRESEKPKAPRSRQKSAIKGIIDQAEDFYKYVHYWSTFKELPAKEGAMCVLASNIEESASSQSVKMHFESKKRSSGGMVTNIIRMIDGILIIFQNPADCKSCLEMKEQTFSGAPLTIFAKRIPTYFERKFIVEGVSSQTSIDTLTMFLEQCSANETSPVACVKQASSGVYVIEYGDDFEPQEASNIMQKIERLPLEKSVLKARKLLRTDCLKVTGIEGDISSDSIRLNFESKRRSDGGPVTRVDFLKNKAILVYFADFTDAERVYEKFRKQSEDTMVIGGHVVEIELYFHSLATDHRSTVKEQKPQKSGGEEEPAVTGQRPVLKACDIQPGCKLGLLEFIQTNQSHVGKLQLLYKNFAAVQISTERRGRQQPFIRFTPNDKTEAEDQTAFKAECKKRFDEFLSSYSTSSPTFEKAKLEKARKANLSALIEMDYKGDGCNIVVSWKNTSVDVLGTDDAVKKFVDQINAVLEFTVRKMEISDEQYRILNACGIIEELKQKYITVKIECDDETLTITLTGCKDDLNTVQIAALTVLNTIEKKKVSTVNTHILAYLSEMKDSSHIREELQKRFKLDEAKVLLFIDDDDVYLRVRTDADYKRAVVSIMAVIKIETVEIDDAISPVVQSPMWKGFTQSLQAAHPCAVYVKPGKEIVAVGIQSHIQEFRKKIEDFLDENATRHFCLKMPYGSARFIVEKCRDFSADACKRLDIICRLTSENGGGVSVEGKRKTLEKVRSRMVQVMQQITELSHTMTEPGIMQYYQGEEGKEFLKMTERANNCIILERKHCPEWERDHLRSRTAISERGPYSRPKPKEQCLTSITLPNSKVSLQVWKANIIEHNCDVIVNASNPELQLLPSGVSGVIKELDSKNGNKIQRAMRDLISENHGSFLSGDALITTAGNLPNCKRIVHAIGPKWHSTSEKDPSKALKACIFNSLQEASKAGMTSIAIPAISCGVFGGDVSVCIPLILEAATEYFKEESMSAIGRVDFIENQKQSVLDEFIKSVNSYGGQGNASVAQQLKPNPRPRIPRISSKKPSLNISLIQGDLTATQADVLVNVTSSQGFQGMNGSAISKMLCKAGGRSILQECAQNPGPHNLGSVITTGCGRLPCQAIYHGIVANYSQNSKQIIKGIVSKCLRTADNTGYRSIAFPAIATGGFRHPSAKVARWMNKEISNFTPANLKNVIIVLFPGDASTISDFNAEFSGAPKQQVLGTASAAFQSASQSKGNFGIVNVSVYQGDITSETSDAIVNSTNANFDLSQGLVSQAIVTQGGAGILTEIQNAAGTDCRVTSGGNLPCQSIFHTATPDNEKDIIKKIETVLDLADQQGITSISFPALATGNIGMNSSEVAHAMRKAFETFGKSQINSLRSINVVIFDQTMLNDFQKGILGPEQSFFGKMKDSISSLFGGKSAPREKPAEEKYNLYLYSTDVEAINRALDAISRETKKMVHSQLIRDEAFGRLSEWELWELRKVETENKVKITDKSGNYIKQIVVEGLTRGVMKAHENIKDILKVFCEAETTASFVTWQKLVHGNWEDYHRRTANILEKAYKARNGNNTDPKLNKITIEEFGNNKLYNTTVDLSNLEGDPNGVNPPNIRRRVNEKSSGDEVPSSWTPMHNQRCVKENLQKGTPEYQNVLNTFVNSGGSPNVISIERIQNVSLYKQYVAKKTEVEKKLKAANSQNPVTRQLFHGTSDYDSIVIQGFDRSFAGKNATALGVGVYFARNASYSHGYASPDAGRQRRMFLADVITGDYMQGNQGIKAAPQKQSGTPNDLYDSVVDNVNNPGIFVVFKDASTYPTYLITYA